MSSLSADIARLRSDIEAQKTQITNVAALVAQQATNIQALKDQIAALQAQGVDTADLELALTDLEKNTTDLQAIVPAAPAAV